MQDTLSVAGQTTTNGIANTGAINTDSLTATNLTATGTTTTNGIVNTGDISTTGNLSVAGSVTANELVLTNTFRPDDINTQALEISESFIASRGATVNMGSNVVRNVAAGEVSATSTDAVNGSQLFQNQAEAFGYTDSKINALEDSQNKAVASSLAFAGLKYSTIPGKFSVGLAGGTWSGETGYALGVNYTTVDGRFGFNSALGGNSDEQGGNVGVSFLIN